MQTTVTIVDGIECKPCPTCKRVLPLTIDYWCRSSQTKTGFQGMCKDCRYEQYVLPRVTGQAARRRGVVYQDSITMKECRSCGEVKNRSEFLENYSWCSECRTAYNRANYSYTPDEGHRRKLLNYGMTVEQYQDMLDTQGGVCLICKKPNRQIDPRTGKSRRLNVDHDHACCPSGQSCGECVRGLLCSACNTTLGLVNESVEHLNALTDYLLSYQAQQ